MNKENKALMGTSLSDLSFPEITVEIMVSFFLTWTPNSKYLRELLEIKSNVVISTNRLHRISKEVTVQDFLEAMRFMKIHSQVPESIEEWAREVQL